MACRELDNRYANRGYVIKEIKWDKSFEKKPELIFPKFNDFSIKKLEAIYDKFNISKIARQAITQQYNEIFIYNEANLEQRSILAPQVKVSYGLLNLPSITYPKFFPLISEEQVWKISENDLKVYLGTRLTWFGIRFDEYKNFAIKVSELCEDFDLREDDILLNPSNIGYHSVLGLRIIDYGLTNEVY